MIRTFLVVSMLLLTRLIVNAQAPALSETASVSLLTISPGSELYSSFGHATLLVEDYQQQGMTAVYNYGTFDFDTPNFYVKFLRGILPYKLSKSALDVAIQYWTYEGRTVTRQHLRLTQPQKQQIVDFLENNYRPENRTYQYKFFYDNCSTRLRDVINISLKDKIIYDKKLNASQTYRDWIDAYAGHQKVADFGMDIAIGIPSDEVTGFDGAMYIPDNLMMAFDSAKVNIDGQLLPFVDNKQVLNSLYVQNSAKKKEIDLPLILSGLLLLTSLYYYFRGNTTGRAISIGNRVLFTIAGLAGWILLFLWFFTEHGVTEWNLNVLWALPIFFPVFLLKPMPPTFYLATAIIAVSTLVIDILQVQDVPLAADFIALALAIRLIGMYKKTNAQPI